MRVFFRDDAVRARSHHAQPAAHNNAVAPADQRFAVGVQRVVHAVFAGEEILRVLAGSAGRGDCRLVQRLYIAASAERFLARALDKNCGDFVVIAPCVEFPLQLVDHFQRQRI